MLIGARHCRHQNVCKRIPVKYGLLQINQTDKNAPSVRIFTNCEDAELVSEMTKGQLISKANFLVLI